MSFSSVMTFGMMPTEEDFSECTDLGKYEDEWDQKVQSMEAKKAERKKGGMGGVVNEQALQPAFQTMERSLQPQMHASMQNSQQKDDEQRRTAVEATDEHGRKSVQYMTKEEAKQADEAESDLASERTAANAYAAAMKPKYSGPTMNGNSAEAQMGS